MPACGVNAQCSKQGSPAVTRETCCSLYNFC